MSAQSEHEARAAIRPVKERVEDELIAREGVVGVDIGEKISEGKPTGELSIVVYVEKKKPDSKLTKAQAIPKEINGVKTDVQELVIELQQAVRFQEAVSQVDTSAYPTLVGGIGIGPARTVFLSPPDVPSAGNYVFVGTLGAIVEDRSSGARMALTNFHVACVNNTWTVGDRMVQPSRVDGGSPTGFFGSLTRAQLTENTDGAVITIDAGRPSEPSVTGIGTVVGQGVASVGMAVQKRGRTTEHTFGTVQSTDFTVSIDYGTGVGTRTLRHQIRIDTDTTKSPRFSDHGDSGSSVMDMNRNVVGLLFAGSNDGSMTFANPIAAALDELDVNLVIDRPTLVTRPVICDFVVTKPAICESFSRTVICNIVTRPAVCNIVTKPAVCDLVTRPAVCGVSRTVICNDLVTRSASCLVTRVSCPTRAVCGPGDFEPGGPVERPRMGQFGGYLDQYGTSGEELEDTFVAGYLAALEALAAEEKTGER
ncbi:hypothetical protein GCM10009841_14540 [Microlunatus panaciterrae]|uniref:Trypsin-like peptidase domain-containing protein n=1 Tax=Microlunatus panaciterrae TaxID=400768 RepID=A0ABS2RQ00_9ACTN|nr:hypothetical protein [Microlunatus panaciterrae]MBM7800014.1 hypothetical protein [Microlunatus panaciterrae]